eukprot:SAG31_NODE_261_length_18904_cov_115.315554_3_plen_414_part_00
MTSFDRGKHTIDFDDGTKLTTNLDKLKKFTVLSPMIVNSFVNEQMALRERTLFDQRMSVHDGTCVDEELLEDERMGKALMEILGEFDGDEDDIDLAKYDAETDMSEDDPEARVKKKKQKRKKKSNQQVLIQDAQMTESNLMMQSTDSHDAGQDATGAETGIKDAVIDLFNTLREAENVLDDFEDEARQTCLSDKQVWLLLNDAEHLSPPQALVGWTLRLTLQGTWGKVIDYVPKEGKTGTHLVEIGGKSTKVKITKKAILAGEYKVLDETIYSQQVSQLVANLHANWLQNQSDRMWGDENAKLKAAKKLEKQKRRAEQRRKLARGASTTGRGAAKGLSTGLRGAKRGVRGAGRGVRGAGSVLQSTMKATEAGLRATTNILEKVDNAFKNDDQEPDEGKHLSIQLSGRCSAHTD